MSGYERKVVTTSRATFPSTDTDGVVLGMLRVPANREVTVFSLKGIIDEVSDTSSAKLEFVEITNSDTIWASVPLTAAGGASDGTVPNMTIVASKFSADSLPAKIESSSSARIFGFKLDKDAGAGVYAGEIVHTLIED